MVCDNLNVLSIYRLRDLLKESFNKKRKNQNSKAALAARLLGLPFKVKGSIRRKLMVPFMGTK